MSRSPKNSKDKELDRVEQYGRELQQKYKSESQAQVQDSSNIYMEHNYSNAGSPPPGQRPPYMTHSLEAYPAGHPGRSLGDGEVSAGFGVSKTSFSPSRAGV